MNEIHILLHNGYPVGAYETLEKAFQAKEEYLNYLYSSIGPGEGIGKVETYVCLMNRTWK